MHWQADSGPVPDLDRVRAIHLADVVDVVAGGDGHADRLSHHFDQLHQVRLGDGQEALGRVDAGRHGHNGRADPVAGPGVETLYGTQTLKR